MAKPLLKFAPKGIYCPQGKFYIDPWKPVEKAVITHAHADHSRWGMKHYLAHVRSEPAMRLRLGQDISLETLAYGEASEINGVKVSLHPAGHIIGSAQVRVEYKGEVWVVSGDYKMEADRVCTPFEPVKCDSFITESTFGLPVYKWRPEAEVFAEINAWWQQNQAEGKTSILYGYSLGKAQRILSGLDPSIGRIYTHGAIENTNEVLRKADIHVPDTIRVQQEIPKSEYAGQMILAPPAAGKTSWMKKFMPYRTAIASGWMALRGPRRRRNVDKGFVLSDHADWEGLLKAVKATEAENVYVTHGYSTLFARYLRELGLNAGVVETEFEGELSEIGEGKDGA